LISAVQISKKLPTRLGPQLFFGEAGWVQWIGWTQNGPPPSAHQNTPSSPGLNR